MPLSEDTLQMQMEQFRSIAENSPNIISRFDRDFRYLYINRPVFNAKLGRIAPQIGDSIYDTGLSEADIELRKQKIRRVFETGYPERLEFKSENQWFDTRFIPESAPDKTVSSVLVISHDITENKKIEAALQKSEWKYRTLADFTYDWEFWLAPDGSYVYVSPACERISGYSPDEFRASPKLMTEIIHPDDQKIWEKHQIIVQTIAVPNQIEFRIIARDGTQRWIGHVCQPVYDPDGRLLGERGSNRDITEQKRAERALRESEEKYRMIFETASEGICQLDEDFNISLANRKMADILGYTVEELRGRRIFEFIDNRHPISQKGESCFKRKDGSELWAIFSGTPVMNDAGQFSFGLLMLTDITGRKQAEEELRKSKQILQTMIDLNSEAVFLMDFKGTVLAANRTLGERLGKNVTEIIGTDIYDLLPPDLREKRRGYIEELIRTGKKAYYEDQRDGRHIGNYINPELDEYGRVTRISVLGVDITERKHYENMLRQNGEKYRTFVETMNEGFIVFGKNMEAVYVNEKFCQITGYGKEELTEGSLLHHLDENNQRIVKEQFENRQNGETVPYRLEWIRKDGSKIFITISPKPVFDSEGKFQGSFAIVNDITSKVEKETMLIFEHQVMKKQVEVAEIQMKDLSKEVEEYNHALKVLLKNSQAEQKKIEENIFSNIRETIDPFIDKLKNTCLNENQKNCLDVIEANLNNLVSPFVGRLKSEMRNFTPMEIQIANLIREGKENKEIADMMNISEYTVMFHRKNIREKLGLKKQKMNLRTYLLSLN